MDAQNDSTAAAKAKLPEANADSLLLDAKAREAAAANAATPELMAPDACDFEDEVPHATLAFAILPEEIESEAAAPLQVAPAAVTAPEAAKSNQSIHEAVPAETTASARPFEVIGPVVSVPEAIAPDAITRETAPSETTASESAAIVPAFEVTPAAERKPEVIAAEEKALDAGAPQVAPTILEAVIVESATRSVIPAESAQTETAVVESGAMEASPAGTISSEGIAAEARAARATTLETTTASVTETNEPAAIAAPVMAQEVAVPAASAWETLAAEIAAPEIAEPNAVPAEARTAEGQASEPKPAAAIENSKVLNRPFRVKLRGSVLVLVRLPNRRDVRAAIHQLSTSGGVIHLEKPLDEKIVVDLIFHLGGKTIREKAQMLFPMWATQGWMQPFRFTQLSEADRQALDGHLKTFMSGEPAKGAAAGS